MKVFKSLMKALSKTLKILGCIILSLIAIFLFVWLVPVARTTKDDRLIMQKSDLDYRYNGHDYEHFSSSGAFVHERNLESAGIITELTLESDYYQLEYVSTGNIKEIYDSKYRTIYEHIHKIEYVDIDGRFISSTSNEQFMRHAHVYFYGWQRYEMPELKPENIEKVIRYIGVPNYEYYGETANEFIESMYAEKDLYQVAKPEAITDEAFIDELLTEVAENESAHKIVFSENQKYTSEINEMQEKLDADSLDGDVTVYYKICFKDTNFPFRLILK